MKTSGQNQIEILFRQTGRVLLGSMLITLTTCWVLLDRVDNQLLFAWTTAMLLITSFRGVLVWLFRRKPPESYPVFASWYVVSTTFSGLTLGLSSYLVPDGFTFELAYIFIIVIAMMAGAVSSLSAYLPAFYSYFFSLYIPFGFRIISSTLTVPDDHFLSGLTFLFISTTPIMIFFGKSINRWVLESYEQLQAKLQLSEKLEKDKEKLRLSDTALNYVNEGIIITNSSLEIIYANEAFCRISGFRFEEVAGKPPEIFQSDENGINRWTLSESRGKWEGEVWNKRKDGQIYPALFNMVPLANSEGKINNYIVHFKDITEKKKKEEELQYFANFDDLTGLPNRKYIYDHLDLHLNRNIDSNFQGSLLFLDLNYFKVVNDAYGHETGDQLLKVVAERLRDSMRENDFVGRLGGDEFVVILKDISKEDTIQIAEKLIDTISKPVEIKGHRCQIGLSVGIALIPEHGSDRRTLMHHADTAMYEAKLQKQSHQWVIFRPHG